MPPFLHSPLRFQYSTAFVVSECREPIKAEKHLLRIPSAAEVTGHGIRVGEMQAKLLAKIEELTLRLIRMEKENLELRREMEAIKASVKRDTISMLQFRFDPGA